MFRYPFLLLALVLAFGLATPSAHGAEEGGGPTETILRFKRLGTAEGLSENSAYCLLQDRRGFLWIGTQDGLNRYDGTGVRVFKPGAHPADTATLASGFILSLAEEPRARGGGIWVATGGGGVARYDPVTERFRVFRAKGMHPSGLASDFVRTVFIDRDGVVWAGTESGLCRYEPRTRRFRLVGFAPGETPVAPASVTSTAVDIRRDAIHSVAQTPDGRLWVGTGDGRLAGLLPRTDVLRTFWRPAPDEAGGAPAVGQRAISVLLADRWRLWLGTEGDGLRAYEPATGRIRTFRPTGQPGALPASGIRSMLRDRAGTLWVATSGGLSRFDPLTETFLTTRHNAGYPTSLPDDAVTALVQDRTGQLWIATESGVAVFTDQPGAFARVPGVPADVWAIAPGGGGQLWVGTETQGVLLLRPGSGTAPVALPLGRGGLPSPFVRALWPERRGGQRTGRLWIGTQAHGLACYDPATGRVRQFRHDPRDSTSLADDYVRGVMQDRAGHVWVSTEGGLSELDPATGRGRSFRANPADPGALQSNYVRQTFEDRSGRLWVTTGGGGLALLDAARRGRFTTFRHDASRMASLPADFVRCVVQTRDGRLWLGSEAGGLARFDDVRPPGRFRAWRSVDGLPSDMVYAIEEDLGGYLWLSTNHGLARFDPKHGTFRRYDARDGLARDEFNAGAGARMSTGHVYFGGPGGLLAFHPDSLQTNRLAPPVVLTGLRVFDQRIVLPDSAIGVRRVLRLRPEQNFLTFEFAALNLRLPEKNRYAYRLRGLDNRWLTVEGNRPEARFTNLSPGAYTFEVRAANNDGVWTAHPTLLHVLIPPPWYRAWWFRLGLVLAFLLLLWAAYQVRVTQLLALERVRHSIARDLHDDMGSTLSSISILSQIASQHHQHHRAEQVAGLLTQIGESSGRMLDSMDDIVWAINPAHDGLDNVTTRMRIFASEVLEARGIEFTFTVAPTVVMHRLEMRARREFFLIFKETVNNLAKYAQCQTARLDLRIEQRYLVLTVEDDGVGFDPTAPARGSGNGLTNMRTRAAALRAKLTFETEPGHGTKVTLRVPV
ncbi:MAG: hypothetical protein H7330_01155 [Hymenobacteraceae bacterium]|nr:hypothetical protein [Hymenobacteraceae bacterium]